MISQELTRCTTGQNAAGDSTSGARTRKSAAAAGSADVEEVI
jgi:hypothetical protein